MTDYGELLKISYDFATISYRYARRCAGNAVDDRQKAFYEGQMSAYGELARKLGSSLNIETRRLEHELESAQ